MNGAAIMIDLTTFLTDLTELSTSQFAKLSPEQKNDAKRYLDQLSNAVKSAHVKLDSELLQCYGEQAQAALRESGRDFGTAYITDGPLRIKFELPKKVTWDQKQLGEIAERVVASGEQVKSYIDVKLSVSESRYSNWPPTLQQQFAAARTVEPGKPSFTLSIDSQES
jgi:hypothetical protein